jgi:hypothetical protein
MTTTRKPNIYLAGKISQRDWRSEIFGDDRFAGLHDDSLLFEPSYYLEFPTFNYVGPFS